MSLPFFRLGTFLLVSAVSIAAACAEEGSQIWGAHVTRLWLDEHVAVAPRARPVRSSYRLTRTRIWASGIARSDMYAFAPTEFDRTVGAKLQPFQDLNFMLGTQLTRGGGGAYPLSGAASWEAFWSRDAKRWGGLAFGLSTAGFVDSLDARYSQSVRGTLGIPLDLSLDRWSTQFRLSPSMNLNTSSGSVGTGLLSEIMGQTVIGSRESAYLSVLNVRLGYSLTQDARPVASAKLEFRISQMP